MSEFLHAVKVIADELSLIDAPVSDDDLTLYVLNGLGSEFRDIVAPIRTRETALSFAELHDLLIGHEQYLKHMDGHSSSALVVTANTSQRRSSNPRFRNNNNRFRQNFSNTAPSRRPSVVCQICDHPGHTAKNCIKLQSSPTANYTTSSAPPKAKWLLDSAASHNTRLTWLISPFTLSIMARMRWFSVMVQVCMLLILVPLLSPLLPALLV